MKLAKIEHSRCNDRYPATYVWVPDEMTEEELDKLVDKAVATYLDYERVSKELTPVKNPGYQPKYDEYPTKTVEEVRAIYNVERAQFDEYQNQVKLARLPFDQILIKVSEHRVESFYNVDPALEATAVWGHNHGITIEYGDTSINETTED